MRSKIQKASDIAESKVDNCIMTMLLIEDRAYQNNFFLESSIVADFQRLFELH